MAHTVEILGEMKNKTSYSFNRLLWLLGQKTEVVW